MRLTRHRHIFLFVCVAALSGCGRKEIVMVSTNHPAAYVNADGSGETPKIDTLVNRFPHMKMADGKITINDRCPVTKAPLNLRLPVLYVNSQPLGFC